MDKQAMRDWDGKLVAAGIAAPVLLGALAGAGASKLTSPTDNDVDTMESAITDQELGEFLTEMEHRKSLQQKLEAAK